MADEDAIEAVPDANVADFISTVPVNVVSADLLAAQLRISSAFRVFDHEGNDTVDVRYDIYIYIYTYIHIYIKYINLYITYYERAIFLHTRFLICICFLLLSCSSFLK